MLLNGTKRSYEVTGETSGLTKDISRYLKNRRVSMMYHFNGVKILSDATITEIGSACYREMIVKRGTDYVSIVYLKGSDEPPDILVAYLKPEKFVKHV